MSKTYYVTSPIYYVNDSPHIGHAYTSTACDVLARFMRLDSREVKFLTGTDEHGQKVEKTAKKHNMEPQKFCDEVAKSFFDLGKKMNFSNDDFIRTTEERHKRAAQAMWQKLEASGNIYLDKYVGWYSVRDEAFYNESELTSDGYTPSGSKVEWVEEESYFFALSRWQDKLLEFYNNNPNFIAPDSRRNEVISFVKSGLNDLSISRTSFNWGVKVPTNDKHVMYVWLDALTNYLSSLGFPDNTDQLNKFWPADVHIIGKDILRFHAVYWPAFLMAAGIEPPKRIVAHGWWTNEGEKISKSVGNVIDPIAMIEEFGLDQTRYFLMREVVFGSDGNFSRTSFIRRINSELSNNFGNLAQRTLAFVAKFNNSQVPEVSKDFIEEIYATNPMFLKAKQALEQAVVNMEKQDFSSVLNDIVELGSMANYFIDQQAPWQLRKDDPHKMKEVLYILLELQRHIATLLQAFIPEKCNLWLDLLAVDSSYRNFASLTSDYALTPGKSLPKPVLLFPKLPEEEE